MTPAAKRFVKRYRPIYDAVARLDVDQEDRELVARGLAAAVRAADPKTQPDFKHDTFVLLASDPLCPCAGWTDDDGVHHPCAGNVEIRVAMHLSAAPDGRSAAWRRRRPVVRCVTCGSMQFLPPYREAVLERSAS